MKIKRISENKMAEVKQLVTKVFMEFEAPEYSEEGVQTFFTTALHNDDFMNSLKIYGAFEQDTLVGVIATRNEGRHIALFFVEGSYHRQGIGRRLFEAVTDDCINGEITVNSSLYAKEVYHRLGFEDTGLEQIVSGIRFIPMNYRK